jgi:hypothetical protein
VTKNLTNNLLTNIFLLILILPSFALAAPTDTDEKSRQTLLEIPTDFDFLPEIHGFFGQGYMQTTQNNYLPKSIDGTTAFSDAGLTFNKQISSNLRAGLQLFARDFGSTGNYQINFDWFVLDYRWRNWLGFRVGKVKIPYGLYNESRDIDAARAPVFLPQSVYPEDQRDYLLAQTGIDLYGYIDLLGAGSLEYQLYRGTLQVGIDQTGTVGLPYQVATETVPYVDGGRVIWETPLRGLRVAGSYQDLDLESNLYVPSLTTTIATTLDVTMAVASVEYTTPRFQLAAEYARWWGQVYSSEPAIIVPTHVDHERYYGMASYKVKEWLQPGALYSITYPNVSTEDEIQDYSKDFAAFCRIDLTSNWIFKAEWHYIDGTSELSPGINYNVPINNLAEYWQMFVAKTTFYF